MPFTQTGATYFRAQLGLPVKDREIIELVICYVIWLDLWSKGWVFGLAQGSCVWSLDVVDRMAIKIKYHNTP